MTILLRMPTRRLDLVFSLAAIAVLAFACPVYASDAPLAPNTRLRVTVVHWMPIKGTYEQWAELGGEFTVTDAGTIVLPIIGSVPVGMSDSRTLASEISDRLQASMKTVEKPDTRVEVLEYPPVYVVGDVKSPGAYPYRAGLNLLQALALGGGELRTVAAEQSRDEIKFIGDIRGYDTEILRFSARIARLRAEMTDDESVNFPPEPSETVGEFASEEVYAQERTIMAARANELERQTKSHMELRELLNAEIGVLQEKIGAVDAEIATVEKELKGVSALVDKGIVVASRRSDLERELAGNRVDRLDQITAIMRARQGVAEATRNMDGLNDRRQTEIAVELQEAQSRLEQILLQREVTQKLLLDLLTSDTSAHDVTAASFTIVRQEAGNTVEFPAEEKTRLRPGDVVKVTLDAVSPEKVASIPLPTTSDIKQ